MQGHNIYVVSPIERREKHKTYMYEEDGITFLRVRTGNIKKNSVLEKGINTLLIEKLYKNAIKKFYANIKFDLILYSTPPITFANVISYIKRKDSAQTYLLLKDIFPQNAIDLNVMKEGSFIHKMFRKKEKFLYEISDYIGCMSDANVKYILEHNKEVNPNKVEVNPNSLNPIDLVKGNELSILEKYKLPKNKLKFIFGGNLGKPQDIPFLIECVKANCDNSNIHFIIVGSGTQGKLVEEYYQSSDNKNLTYIGQLPKKDYDNLIAVADVGMIFLNKNFTIPNVPSRILSYMEARLPVLIASDNSTDIGYIAEKNNFGHKCDSSSVEDFTQTVKKFYSYEERYQMGKNSREYLEENYTIKNTYETIIKHFN